MANADASKVGRRTKEARARETTRARRRDEDCGLMESTLEYAHASLPADIEQTYLHNMQATHVGRYPG